LIGFSDLYGGKIHPLFQSEMTKKTMVRYAPPDEENGLKDKE